MSLAQALFAKVANSASVIALIGARFRPGVAAPKDKLPFADYIIISDVNEKYVGGRTKWRFATVEVVAYADDHPSAEAVADAIRLVLEATSGAVSGVDGIRIRVIHEIDNSDQPDLGRQGQSKGPFAVSKLYRVKYQSST